MEIENRPEYFRKSVDSTDWRQVVREERHGRLRWMAGYLLSLVDDWIRDFGHLADSICGQAFEASMHYEGTKVAQIYAV